MFKIVDSLMHGFVFVNTRMGGPKSTIITIIQWKIFQGQRVRNYFLYDY